MPFAVQRGPIANALARFFALKGSTDGLQLDSTIVPTINIADLDQNPLLRYGIPCGGAATQAEVPAEISGLVVSPAAANSLCVRQITISNVSASNNVYILQLMTAAQIAALTTLGAVTNLVDLSGGSDGVGAGALRPSTLQRCADATFAGTAFWELPVPPATAIVVDLPRAGVSIFGNDPNGIPGIAVVQSLLNTAFTASFLCEEWPLPGQ